MATLRQRKALQKISENVGNKPLGRILKEVGYSDSVSKTPSRVTNTKGWKELINDYFPEELILKAHKRLLEKKEIVAYQGEFRKTGQPHSDVKYALDLLYKLKGLYKEEDFSHVDKSGRFKLHSMSSEELDKLEKELKLEHRLLYERFKKYGRKS